MKNSDFILGFNNLPNDNILRDQVYTIKIPSENFEITYDLIGLHKFVEEQNENWNKINILTNSRFKASINFFSKLLVIIESSITNTKSDSDKNREILRTISNIQNTILLSNSQKTIFLVKLYNKYPVLIDGAFDCLIQNIQSIKLPDYNYLKGVLLATNYEIQDIDVLLLREGEEISFSEIRNKFVEDNNESREKFEEIFNDSKKSASKEIESLKKIKEKWDESFFKMFDEWTLKAEKEMNKSQETAIKLLKKSLQSKIELEQTYREQMKFQVPAEYWKQRANELNIEGHKFMKWLITIVFIGALLLFTLLWISPEDMLESIFSKSPVRAIRWSIIFITFISFLFFGIQALKKAMFSSFHLARDAEEREKLTLFYLSLIKDTTITQEDRSLVLQSLFSRAETGMLKDDGNPTMPSIFDKIKG
jgi:hypothetical protein